MHKVEEDWAKGELCGKVILQRSLLCMWQYYIVILVWLARPS